MSGEPFTCRGCGKARSLDELVMYYDAARGETDPERRAVMTLELCHSLILELANHVYCLHGQSTCGTSD